MTTVELGDLAVHFVEHGEGRPILMLHGWPGTHLGLTTFLEPRFAGRTGWRRIYPDLPGMGATPGPGSIADQAGMLDATLRFIDAVAPGQRFAVAGASYGGYLALGVLHERWERIDGLFLSSPMLDVGGTAIVPPHRVFEHDPGIDAILADDERPWLDISVMHTRRTLEAFRTAIKPGFAAADRTFLRRVAEHLAYPFDHLAIPAGFEAPTLLLSGRQDSAVGYARLASMLESFPRATLAILDRAGHGVAEERHDLFATLVDDWLDRMELEGRSGDAR